ncbi:Syntaxin-1A [Perkinsus chesapeaki]|uniref:Syntaxin-1A n=1 Tax=Perkinsus chesapeaki TaxID=330153 RepID=A0A7J6MZQ8_PERCH|nr:Syntaxin-1A [Perkinsus chesapeaki]
MSFYDRHQCRPRRYNCLPGGYHLLGARSLSANWRMYPARLKRSEVDLDAHAGCVNTLCWSEDGQLLLSGSDDTHLMLWRYSDITAREGLGGTCRPAEIIHTGHSSNIFHSRFFPDRSFLVASCSLDGSVKVIDIENGIVLETSSAHKDMVTKLVIPWDSPQLVISCSADSTIRQFDLRAGPSSSEILSRWADWRGGINAISGGWAMRPYSILAGGDWPVVQLYDRRRMGLDGRASHSAPGPQPVVSLRGPAMSNSRTERLTVSGVCLSQSGRVGIGSWMNGEGIYAFDIDNPNKPIGPPFKGHANSRTVKEVSFIGLNQEYVASGSDDGNWFAWRLRQGHSSIVQEMASCDDPDSGTVGFPIDPRLCHVGLNADSEVVNCVQQHPTDFCVATAGIDNDIKIWRPSGDRSVRPSVTDIRRICRENSLLEFGRSSNSIASMSAMLRLLGEQLRRSEVDDSSEDEAELEARRRLRELIDRLKQLQDAARDRGVVVKVNLLGLAAATAATAAGAAAVATSAATTAGGVAGKPSPVFDDSAMPTDTSAPGTPQDGKIGTGTEVAAFLGVSWKASEAKAEAEKRQAMDEFYTQAGDVQRNLGQINKNLDQLDQKRIDVINATSQQQEQAIRDDVDEIVGDVNRDMVGTKKKIEAMGESTKAFEDKFASKCHIASELRIRNGMEQAGLRRLNEYLKRFQKLQTDFNSDIREKALRQLAIAVPAATEEEREAMVDQGVQPQEQYFRSKQDRITKLQGLRDRYESIQRLEQSIQEVNQMMIELALLVEQQGEMLDSIEFNVVNTKNNAARTERALIKGRKKQKRNLWFKFCICVCCVVCILALVLGLLSYFKVLFPQQSRATRAFSTYKSAHQETPLTYYRATQHATSSINHRLAYVNAVFVFWVCDSLNAMVDW